MMEKRKRLIYMGIAFVILLWVALSTENDCYFREFNYATLERYFQDSLTVDENGEYSGTLATTPEISLPPGRYVVTINYDTDTDNNMFYITSGNEAFESIEGNLLAAPSCRELSFGLEHVGRGIYVGMDYAGTGRLSIKNVEIRSEQPVCTDRFAIGATALVLLGIWVWLDMKNSPARKTYLWILALGLVASLPYIHQYLIDGHDIRFHLARIEEIVSGLKDGQFPVYIQPDAVKGYGYAAPLLYPQLFLYFPALLRLAGVSMVTAVGIFLLSVNLATAGIMYFCAHRIFSCRFTALMSSLLYTFAMYRLINQCTRFAIGELLAMAFLPLVICGLYEVLLGDQKKWPWLAIGCCGVLQSHVISTVFTVMIIAIFCLVFIRKLLQKQRFFAMLKAGIWTVLLNLWFIVPFLDMFGEDLHTGYLRLQIGNMSLSFVQVFQMFPLSRGDTSFVDQSLNGTMPVCLGVSLLFFSACFLYGIAVGEYKKEKKMPVLCLCLGILFTVMTTQWFPWNALFHLPFVEKLVSFFQFPWRFLACATVFLSFCAGAGATWLRDRYRNTAGVLALVLVFAILPMGYYIDDVMRGDIRLMKEEVASCDETTGNEYLYEHMDLGDLAARTLDPLPVNNDGFEMIAYERQRTHMRLDYNLQGTDQAEVELATLYYPGYEILYQNLSGGADGKTIQLTGYPGYNQYLTVSVPPGTGRLMIRYRGTLLWRGCFLASLAALIGFCVVLRAEKKNLTVFEVLLSFRDRRKVHGSR